MMDERKSWLATYWGIYEIIRDHADSLSCRPWDQDPDPAIDFEALEGFRNRDHRVGTPLVRKSYLEKGVEADRSARGEEPMVRVDWDTALDLASASINRVRSRYGNQAIYAGSYGWASPGRFHHAQSQLKRFLNLAGGFTTSVNTYSSAAAEVLIPHVLGDIRFKDIAPRWSEIIDNTDLIVSFGGLKLKNARIDSGVAGRHADKASLASVVCGGGKEWVVIDPVSGAENEPGRWVPIVPNSDTALILALCYVLVSRGLHDVDFLDTYSSGSAEFIAYVMGEADGTPKNPEWAEALTGVPKTTIETLALRMARSRTLITITWALQRADRGEHAFWASIALACLLGQLNLPGGGIAMGLGSFNNTSEGNPSFPFASLAQGANPVDLAIPVSRFVEMLERPGAQLPYNGRNVTMPDVQLVYWAGGNPFHHHQDLKRLKAALTKPETIIVHEPWHTGFAGMADIVLPVTTILERDDIATSRNGGYIVPMKRVEDPFNESRSDHSIFRDLAARLGFFDAFTEGLSEQEWVARLYNQIKESARQHGEELPPFDHFWHGGPIQVQNRQTPFDHFKPFLDNPKANPLNTESGRIVISSGTIKKFGYQDFGHHPNWAQPREWSLAEAASAFPFHLISDQPVGRLHSQLISVRAAADAGEGIMINEDDAEAKGITEGDRVRVHNRRGECYCTAVLSPHIKRGVVKISTGSRFRNFGGTDMLQVDQLLGNPNMLTYDKGCSPLSQGPSAQTCLVDLERSTSVETGISSGDACEEAGRPTEHVRFDPGHALRP